MSKDRSERAPISATEQYSTQQQAISPRADIEAFLGQVRALDPATKGGERGRLTGLHPHHEVLDFQLPDDRPRMLVELPGVGQRTLEPRLGTVLIEPDEERVTLTWAGVIEVAMIYPDEVIRGMRWAVVWSRKAEAG